MYGQYIPDLTERFPEGFGGIDLTDKYFPRERRIDLEEVIWGHSDYDVDEEEENFIID